MDTNWIHTYIKAARWRHIAFPFVRPYIILYKSFVFISPEVVKRVHTNNISRLKHQKFGIWRLEEWETKRENNGKAC